MTKFQRWILTIIAKQLVVQGSHKSRMVEYYKIMTIAAREEFTEDNNPTLDHFLHECHTEALVPTSSHYQ